MRMSLETYTFLKGLLALKDQEAQTNYLIASRFIKNDDGGKAMEHANEVYQAERKRIGIMFDELHAAAASTYKDHPFKEMREFWGLE